MEDRAYLMEQAKRYFRLARAKSDREIATSLEAMARAFLAKAETWQPKSGAEAAGHSPFVVGLNVKPEPSVLARFPKLSGA